MGTKAGDGWWVKALTKDAEGAATYRLCKVRVRVRGRGRGRGRVRLRLSSFGLGLGLGVGVGCRLGSEGMTTLTGMALARWTLALEAAPLVRSRG